ncbi:MAG: hypothetical protein AAF384_17950, partial [Pseudomonadota bacterium]
MNDYPYDLGPYSRAITTTSKDAQTWFDRGLNWTFGYHHEEALVCFKHALESDPHCAMAHWGIAYVLGPNYNKPWELFDPRDMANTLSATREAHAAAAAAAENASPVEQALIAALEKRYQSETPIDDLYVWSTDYANTQLDFTKIKDIEIRMDTTYVTSNGRQPLLALDVKRVEAETHGHRVTDQLLSQIKKVESQLPEISTPSLEVQSVEIHR